MFSTFDDFVHVFDKMTEIFGVMVINNKINNSNIIYK
jgi:hypothetical protein